MSIAPFIILLSAWLGPPADLHHVARQNGAAAQPQLIAGASVQVVTTAGAVYLGSLQRFDLDGELEMFGRDGGQTTIIPASEIIGITTTSNRLRPAASVTELQLTDGDRVLGEIIGASGDFLHVAAPGVEKPLAINLADLALMRTFRAADRRLRDHVRLLSAGSEDAHDHVLLANGDMLTGLIAAIDAENVTLEQAGTPRTLPMAQVAAVRLATDAPRRVAGRRAHLRLVGGTCLTLTRVTWDGEQDVVGLYRGTPIQIHGASIVDLEIRSEQLIPLTDLGSPIFEEKPLGDEPWGYRINQNVLGGPLSAGERTFRTGFGVHAESTLRFALPPGIDALVVSFCLDALAGPWGGVEAEIRVDGQTRHQASINPTSGLVGPVRVELAGANTLELVVAAGSNGALQDRLNWISPVLVRP